VTGSFAFEKKKKKNVCSTFGMPVLLLVVVALQQQ
jgi:hypothetical protein